MFLPNSLETGNASWKILETGNESKTHKKPRIPDVFFY